MKKRKYQTNLMLKDYPLSTEKHDWKTPLIAAISTLTIMIILNNFFFRIFTFMTKFIFGNKIN